MSKHSMIRRTTRALCTALAVCLSAGVAAAETVKPLGTHEYLLTVSRPNQLHIIDTRTNKIARSCDLPKHATPGLMALSPDNTIAYVLVNGWEDVLGIDLRDCTRVFAAHQSQGDVRVKSFASVAVSTDGKTLYTVQNRVRMHRSHFEALEPLLAVFNTADGLDAKPVRTFPVDRRITTIAATAQGKVILGGADIKQIDPANGTMETLVELQSWKLERWMTPDAFAMFNGGEQSNEYVMPYVTAKFKDDTNNMETAEWWWGMTRINLATGKLEQEQFTPFEFIMFNVVSDPRDHNIVYGVFNNLSKHDVAQKKMLKATDVDHTYYNINISGDGKRVYIGGTASDIAVYDTDTLKKITNIRMPGGMSASDLRIVKLAD